VIGEPFFRAVPLVGAYVALGSGEMRVAIAKAETDLEGANSAAKFYDSAWAGTRAALDELEAANRARIAHNDLKPPDSATRAEKDQWAKEVVGFAKRYNDALERVRTALQVQRKVSVESNTCFLSYVR
jgi:hypothetical protein